MLLAGHYLKQAVSLLFVEPVSSLFTFEKETGETEQDGWKQLLGRQICSKQASELHGLGIEAAKLI